MRMLVGPARIVGNFLAEHTGNAKARPSECHPPSCRDTECRLELM